MYRILCTVPLKVPYRPQKIVNKVPILLSLAQTIPLVSILYSKNLNTPLVPTTNKYLS